MQVMFLEVKDNHAKLNRICSIVQHHFALKEPVLIKVPSPEAAAYIDQLLWRLPEESFLPHAVAQTPCHEMIAITTAPANINKAKVLMNLCTEEASFISEFSTVYELLDCTHPEKEALSRKRMAAYQAKGYRVLFTDGERVADIRS